ncbi:dTDP-4-dehydrorhamnose 3,5-epimerase [Ralstonia pickettii]|uniref:dTDP-4-dehydrorhamnose 3,5-epimerase n=1 Tax=Ralstonia pickettii TaxID=329 RepID=UPI0027154353|nr:dTDP-4-dehydrorhamnose 3,5-epimerase [Ralstonia pickettii]WKZ85924.1 dTDP-4-dehydrorhamnose 3,5-epimerase [Ralstonia pickettii]
MKLTVTPTTLPGVLLLEPKVFGDSRGFFFESFSAKDFEAATGLRREFVQDNHSRSVRNVLRGLHYQIQHPQGKLVRVVAGEVFDVAVDIRKDSPTFGRWVGVTLSAENKRQLWVPEGFAHGFLVTSDSAEFAYKTTEYWYQGDERCIAWNDPDIGVAWPITAAPVLSDKDARAPHLSDAEVFASGWLQD